MNVPLKKYSLWVLALSSLLLQSGCIFRTNSRPSAVISSEDSQRIKKMLVEKYNGFYTNSPQTAYTQLDPQLFAKEIYPLVLAGEPPKLLGDDHASVQLVQGIVHKIHSTLMDNISAIKNVPEPKAVVISESIPNAFVTVVYFCAPVEVRSKASMQVDESKSSWLVFADGVFSQEDLKESPPGPSGCPEKTLSRPDLLPFMVNSLQEQQPTCKFENRDGKIFIEDVCFQKISKGGRIPGIVYAAQASMVVVYSGLLKTLEQQHMEAVIAHELGHYYRRHGLLRMSGENGQPFFFKVGDYTNRMSRPRPEDSPETTQLANLLRKTGNWITGRFPEQKYHPAIWSRTEDLCWLFDLQLRRWSKPVPPAFTEACSDFKKKSESSLPSHQRYESGVRNLTRSERLEIDKSIEKVLQTMSQTTFADLFKLHGPKDDDVAYIRKRTLDLLYDRYSVAVPASVDQSTVVDRVNELNMSLLEKEKQVQELISKAQESGFGWYTTEIEADEIAAYLLALAGMDPSQTIDLVFKTNTLSSSGFGPAIEDCRKSFLNGWKHWVFNGKPWVPFWGVPNDPHPSNCFRAYNVDLEIKAQNLPHGQYTRSSDEWRLMQSSLK